MLFTSTLLVLVGGAGALVYYTMKHPVPITGGAPIGQHWHASYKIYICGERMANYPTVEGEIHSHGDGFLHIHPQTEAFANDNANLATFLRLYETSFTQDKQGRRVMTFPTGTKLSDGQACSDKKHYKWIFTNKGKRIKGDPSKYLPHNGDVLVMQFGKRGNGTLPNPYSIVHPEAGVGQAEPPGTTPGPDVTVPQQLPSVPPTSPAKPPAASPAPTP